MVGEGVSWRKYFTMSNSPSAVADQPGGRSPDAGGPGVPDLGVTCGAAVDRPECRRRRRHQGRQHPTEGRWSDDGADGQTPRQDPRSERRGGTQLPAERERERERERESLRSGARTGIFRTELGTVPTSIAADLRLACWRSVRISGPHKGRLSA